MGHWRFRGTSRPHRHPFYRLTTLVLFGNERMCFVTWVSRTLTRTEAQRAIPYPAVVNLDAAAAAVGARGSCDSIAQWEHARLLARR